MSCFGCSRKYGLFCKEYGCPNCGYSYCAKCLKRPVAVPRHNNKTMNVCLICFDKLSKMQTPEKVIDVEALPGTLVSKSSKAEIKENTLYADINALLKLEPSAALIGDVLEPISANKEKDSANHSDINENLDSQITKRLKNLKSTEQTVTDDELHTRLANLNGIPQKDYSKKDLLLNTDQRSDQEKMNDLLKQFMGEVELNERLETERGGAISDIEKRLRALRDTPVDDGPPKNSISSPDTNTPSDNEQDEETMLKGIIEKYLAESHLPAGPSDLEVELNIEIPKPHKDSADTEELPWCNICNEDAVYRCKGCDGELFCAQCFRDCHEDDEEYRNHVKENFSAPPKFKENHF
uniref:FYVE-type domain-containing protein n=1 Tax=Glossina brevipalpis TaxID=37001 RepID=A0A1A9W8I6_9MUSC